MKADDYQRANELRYANDALKTDIHKQRDTKKQELHSVREDCGKVEQELKALQQALLQYKMIIDERKRYIAYEYMKLNHKDIQELVEML